MRLHRLSVQAFGPFPDRVEVDLDELASSGLFLIHGPTGAGKTSLLDAISFALYAAVPGARPAGRSLRSDHATGQTAPRVELELTAGGRRLRIVRSPEFRRPKRRGAGETTVPASVMLSEWVGGAWAPLSHRADEVGLLIRDVLGMGMEQFAKVVLLPQGDFAAFLGASPEARRQLLERLFDVSRFTDVEEWLVQQRRATAADLADTRAQLATHLTRVDDVLARLPPQLCSDVPGWADVPLDELPAVLGSALHRVRELAASTLAASAAAQARERETASAYDSAVRQVACRRKGEQADALLGELDRHQEHLDGVAGALALGRRAGALAGDLRALADATARSAAVAERAGAAAAQVRGLGLSVTGTIGGESECQRVAGLVAQFAGCLAEAGALERALAAAARRVDEQSDHVRRAQQAGNRLDEQIEQLDLAAAQTARAAAAVAVDAAALPHAQMRLEVAGQLLRRRRVLDGRLDVLAAAHARAEAAAAAADLARVRWLDLRQAHLEAMAARLAAGLVDGQPCPVCGSARHPGPADPADAVPDELVSAAEADWASRQARLSEARSEVAAASAQVVASREDLGGEGRDAVALAADLEVAQRSVDTTTAQIERLAALREQLDETHERLGTTRAEREAAERTVQEQAGRRAEMQAEVQRLRRELREGLDRHTEGCPCVGGGADVSPAPSKDAGSACDRALARHGAVASALAELREALRALAEAGEHESRTSQALAARLSESGFASVSEARDAVVSEQVLAEYERELRQAERARVQAQTVLADAEVVAAMRHDEPDLAGLDEQLGQARRARQQADRASALAEQSDTDLTHLRALVVRQAQLVSERTQRHAAVARLADTATGIGPDNVLRMRLSAYVLASRLERVVELANERLRALGDGRYRLRHCDAPVAGGRRSGLGLAIEDLWTGRARDTATLSGGESFLASLALALGLADAVREEAGGFDLQTLFVDEGFGSLDDESLEQVLDVLDELRDGGRAVGLVSHVAELRMRIPNQLRIEKTTSGSVVVQLGCVA
ncbi:MAG: AAA family ATPase [Dermatophilaceae bacterium]